ncbi:MAG: HAD family hydrolase [Sinobacteraceae bacterium]|nr:HAD family hydrolase [Nevskiaceae bacterium]
MTASPDIRIAMWSGPRNVSTALMRSFGNRNDSVVIDEPFYAHYLRQTGLDHPGREEVLTHQDNDWQRVAQSLHAPLPAGVSVFYQKHMSHHLLPNMGREWLRGLQHAFLLRDPADMLRSLEQKLALIRAEDTGLPQQVEIFDRVRKSEGQTPPVIDAADLLENPQGVLSALCARLGIEFQASMLCWPPGPRATDGIWAKHWYEQVERSSGFLRSEAQRGEARADELPAPLAAVERRLRPMYDYLRAHALRAVPS